MAEEARWQEQCLEALKAIGKALGQMSLYRIGHPAVAETLKTAFAALEAAERESGGAEISFSIIQGKIIANGRMIGLAAKVPSAVPGFFERLRVGSLTFTPGLRMEELEAFCELSPLRREALGGVSPKDYLSKKGVEHIVLDEAVYARVSAKPGLGGSGAGPGPGAGPGLGAGAGPGAGGGPGAGAGPGAGSGSGGGLGPGAGPGLGAGPGGGPVFGEGAGSGPEGSADFGAGGGSDAEFAPRLAGEKSLDGAMRSLIARAVADPGQREKVRETVAGLLEQDIRRRVDEATKPLREAKTRVENEQARTEGVLHQAVDGVIVVDEQGKILMMNPVAEQVWGAPLSQAAGLPVIEKAGENQVVTLAAELATPPDRAIDVRTRTAAPADLRRSVQASGAVVQTEAGKIVGMVAGPTDAAKYREAERMQREFVAHVTHELRSPLSSIRAALEILQGEAAPKLGAEHGRMLATAVKNSDRLADLISSILDFSKIEAGQMEVRPAKADAAALAREAAESLAAWAQKKSLRLSCEAAPGLPPVRADGPRTVQVLLNLLSNAIKFTPSGGAVVVRVGSDPEDRRRLRFSVSDTGPGIPKGEQDKVFEKFVQIAAGDLHPGGTGLGLSIAKALVHLQQGRMWLESGEGKGATFFFTLPVFVAQASDAADDAGKLFPKPWWKRILGL
ncbi:MAG TPA: ATP-binding protein [Elusimicrobiota bacterium]|nr:ATP-binding protein [Elusimicrobiota bacterium]